ncbi:nicotinate phosphoribosyltransferase [archaeon]|jgi:nicotinate phosphoribosyltransferase|nr:nicotinate phosphoribosyltransferase [archaeon]MBT7128478.1 nicotinate phosphoribosyltransferase [archaeon]
MVNTTRTTESFLDTDMYKLTMGQFAFHRYNDVSVKYAFKNRTKDVSLPAVVDEGKLRQELDRIQYTRPTSNELTYLAGLKNNGEQLFKDDYLGFLENIVLPDYNLTVKNGEFDFEVDGPWGAGIYWETPALATFNTLYYRGLMQNMDSDQLRVIMEKGANNLERKIETLEENPNVRFMEFGTRRRFDQEWQEGVVSKLKARVPNQIVGTSNVYLAMKLGLEPMGTNAHEMDMVMSGIYHDSDLDIKASHNRFLEEWFDEYGVGLSIALTDTYGSDFFLDDMSYEQARNWKGLRQDSGDPAAFARRQIGFYEKNRIDPKTKLFVPSDGLNVEKIADLQNEFGNRINVVAGWGTNLTNDLGLRPLSLVMKAVESNGYGTVKLSDNPAKTMGSLEDVARFKDIFDYDDAKYAMEECVY